MKRRQILLDDMDDTSDRIGQMAQLQAGNRSRAIYEALKTRQTAEAITRELGRVHATELRGEKSRCERSFREGTVVSWEARRRNRL